MTAEGNFEGHNILNRLKHLPRSMEDEQRLAPLREQAAACCASKRVRPGLDDKVLADWNGLMIAALANAGIALRRADLAAAWPPSAFMFIAAQMGQGDRLGHSWREGRLLFPGLASDHAAMIRAALALHEATGEHGYLERALAWQAHARPPLRQSRTTAAISSPPTTPKAWWCGPSATTDDATPNPNALAAQNLVRLAVLTGQHAWREQADRLFDGMLASAGDNVFGHLALLNALDLRLRGAEIVVTGRGRAAPTRCSPPRASLPFLDRVVLRAPIRDALPASHPAQEKIAAATARRRLRLRRRNLLACR